MSRRIRFLLALLFVSFSLATAACADATAPHGDTCEQQSGNTCH